MRLSASRAQPSKPEFLAGKICSVGLDTCGIHAAVVVVVVESSSSSPRPRVLVLVLDSRFCCCSWIAVAIVTLQYTHVVAARKQASKQARQGKGRQGKAGEGRRGNARQGSKQAAGVVVSVLVVAILAIVFIMIAVVAAVAAAVSNTIVRVKNPNPCLCDSYYPTSTWAALTSQGRSTKNDKRIQKQRRS